MLGTSDTNNKTTWSILGQVLYWNKVNNNKWVFSGKRTNSVSGQSCDEDFGFSRRSLTIGTTLSHKNNFWDQI